MMLLLRRVLGFLVSALAALLIVLALLVGLARLLLPVLPEYREQIRQFANDATGVLLDFEGISASWPLAGPELRFIDVRIRTRAGEPVLDADELTVGISLLSFVLERQLVPQRFGLSGAVIEIEQAPEVPLRLNGVPLSEFFPRRAPARESTGLPRIDLRLDAVLVGISTPGRRVGSRRVELDDLRLGLGRDALSIDGVVRPDGPQGGFVRVDGRVPLWVLNAAQAEDEQQTWPLSLDVRGVALAEWLEFALDLPTPVSAGRLDAELELGFAGRLPASGRGSIVLRDLALRPGEDEAEVYDSLATELQWSVATEGWGVALDRLSVTRDGRTSPAADLSARWSRALAGEPGALSIEAGFLRLSDLYPLIRSVASQPLRAGVLPTELDGDLRDVALSARLETGRSPTYTVSGLFERLGFMLPGDRFGFRGLSGSLAADQEGGRARVESGRGDFVWPAWFAAPLEIDALNGLVVWRTGPLGVRLLGDDVRAVSGPTSARSRFSINLPREGLPTVDLTLRIDEISARRALAFTPVNRFPPVAAAWLDQAVVSGRITGTELLWTGPLRGVPYAQGQGRFRVELDIQEGVLDYGRGWPQATGLSGKLVFDGPTLRTERNAGTVAGIAFQDIDARMADMRNGELTLRAAQSVPLAEILRFLRESPLAEALGPTLGRVAGSGDLAAELSMLLPVRSLADYRLQARLVSERSSLALEGVDFGLDDLSGVVELRNAELSAERLEGRFLGEPITIALAPAGPDEPAYSHVAKVQGSTPVDKLIEAFALPRGEDLSGIVGWDATVLVPARREGASTPLHILVASPLEGLESRLPAPAAKAAAISEPLTLDLAFPGAGEIELTGRLARGITWALAFDRAAEGWRIERGAIHVGAAPALLPVVPGVEVSGRVGRLELSDWLSRPDGDRAPDVLRQATLDVDELSAFGQILRDVSLDARLDDKVWTIGVDGPGSAGQLFVPLDAGPDSPIVANLARLWLDEQDAGADGASDPRDVVATRVLIEDFGLAGMRLGRLSADLRPQPEGVLVAPLTSEAPGLKISGEADWRLVEADPARARTGLRLDLETTDLAAALEALDYGQLMEGRQGRVSLDVHWPGRPGAAWRSRIGGRLEVSLEDGRLLAVEPGGGRVLGLLSVAALPRRLALDFSDVVDEGLRFDRVSGEFLLEDGKAYTCNLGLVGPVTDLAIVGQTDVAAGQYDQLAVVRPHVSDVLALGGAVLGGPGIGATMLLISQIFRRPLSALGESYYRVVGPWDNPAVNRVQRSEVDISPFRNCEQYLASVLPPPAAEPEQGPGEQAAPPGADPGKAP